MSENSFFITNVSFNTHKMTLNYNWCNYFKLYANWILVLVINWNSIFQKNYETGSSSDSNNQDQHINDFKTNCYGHVEVVVEKWDSKFCLLLSLSPKGKGYLAVYLNRVTVWRVNYLSMKWQKHDSFLWLSEH